jgi:indolepyruvate ferredoxin oxidoreductase
VTWPGQRAELERRLIEERLPAARAWARANRLDRTVVAAAQRSASASSRGQGPPGLDAGLRRPGLDAAALQALGISVYKVAMSWPLETEGALAFAQGHEEAASWSRKSARNVEAQLKDALYHRPAGPRVTARHGKARPVLPEVSEFTPLIVARALAARFGANGITAAARAPGALEARVQPVPRRR